MKPGTIIRYRGVLGCALLAACSSSTGPGAQVTQASGGTAGSSAAAGQTSGGSLTLSFGNGGESGVAAGSSGTSTGGVSTQGGSAPGGSGGNSDQDCPFGDQMVHATSYGMATTLRACLVKLAITSQRFTVTMPTEPAGGGYVVVSFRKVAPQLRINVAITPAYNALEIPIDTQLGAPSAGADYDTWFAAVPGTSFFIDVESANSLQAINPQGGDFEMSATYVPVNDAYEPNNPQNNAKPIALNTPIVAYSFYGYGTDRNDFLNGWYDFYKVTLSAGTPTLKLTGASPKVPLEVSLFSTDVRYDYDVRGFSDDTGSVTITASSPASAGDYWVVIQPEDAPDPYGEGTVPADYVTQPYTLTVTEQ
jgi:hypothetical protein